MPVVADYTALLSSFSWTRPGPLPASAAPTVQLGAHPVFLTYSFETSPSAALAGPDARAGFLNSFRPLTAPEQAAAMSALGQWAAASGVVFLPAPSGEGALRFAVYDTTLYGAGQNVGFVPSVSIAGADIVLGAAFASTPQVLLHDIGLALGFKAPQDGAVTLDPTLDTFAHTVLSRVSGGDAGDRLGDLDLAAAAALYGAPGTGGSQVTASSYDAAAATLTQRDDRAGDTVLGARADNVIIAASGAQVLGGAFDNTITAGADAAVTLFGNGVNRVTAGTGAVIDLLSAQAVVTVGDGGTVRVRSAAEVAATGTTPAGAYTVTLGAGGLFVADAQAYAAPAAIHVGEGGRVFTGPGDDVTFVTGRSFVVSSQGGVDVAVVAGPRPAAGVLAPSPGSSTLFIVDNGVGPSGAGQRETFSNQAYIAFDDALYSTAKQAYVDGTGYPVLRSAVVDVLRQGGSAPAVTALARLADQVDSGGVTSAAALSGLLASAVGTTSVAVLTYQFFTGRTPTAGGVDYLVSPTGPNPDNLNSAYYQDFNVENRYINFAVNLGRYGEGAAAFQAAHGVESLFDTTRAAYAAIFGATPTDAKLHDILDATLTLNGATFTRAQYFGFYGGDGAAGLGTKAAAVGWLLAEAEKADTGVYARAEDLFLSDLVHGRASFGIDLVGAYGNAASHAPG